MLSGISNSRNLVNGEGLDLLGMSGHTLVQMHRGLVHLNRRES
jgi:hypothetical protein